MQDNSNDEFLKVEPEQAEERAVLHYTPPPSGTHSLVWRKLCTVERELSDLRAEWRSHLRVFARYQSGALTKQENHDITNLKQALQSFGELLEVIQGQLAALEVIQGQLAALMPSQTCPPLIRDDSALNASVPSVKVDGTNVGTITGFDYGHEGGQPIPDQAAPGQQKGKRQR
jgi:hypothetical protein